MPGHDIIVIGTSAGGLEPLTTIAAGLPADLPAALFIVQHTPATGVSLLPEILDMAGALPASHAVEGARIQRGQIYVAPPDHHVLVEREHMHVVRGPKENGFRPAIDATFRTAARAYGPRVVGVILTGMLDDGTTGLLAVKRRGGVAIVQDPAEAAYPSMPESACRYVTIDAILKVADMPRLLLQLANQAAEEEGAEPMPENIDLEANISDMDRAALQQADQLGTLAPFSCPDCGGVLAEFYDGDLLRFRCQVGHAYSRDSLLASQADMLDQALWASFRALDERANLVRRLVRDARVQNDTGRAWRFTRLFEQVEQQKEQVRLAMLKDDSDDSTTLAASFRPAGE